MIKKKIKNKVLANKTKKKFKEVKKAAVIIKEIPKIVFNAPINKNPDNDYNSLKDRCDSYKSEISSLRKKGNDTKIVELRLIEANQKVAFFKVSLDKNDYYKCVKLLDNLSKDLEDIKNKVVSDSFDKQLQSASKDIERYHLDS